MQENNLSFRKASECDVDSVLEIEKKCFAHPWSRGMFYNDICENQITEYVVVSVNGSDAGYGGMWIISGEAHITNICIVPEYRRRGIATMLMKRLMQTAFEKKAESMTLEVRVSNVHAMKLYEKMGFHIAGKRRGYYSDNGEDAYVLWNNQIEQLLKNE